MALFKTENSAGDVLDVTDLDFVGDGVDVSIAGTTVSVAIPGNPPGGSVGAVQYKTNPKTHGGATYAAIDNGDLILKDNATPVAPTTGSVKLFCEDVGGRKMLGQIGPSGLDTPMQPFMGRNKVCYWSPIGNATTAPLAFGIVAPTATGTATARNVATTNLLRSTKRLGYVSAATAGSLCGARGSALQFFRGNADFMGGFSYVCRFGVSDPATVSGARMFVGLQSSTSAPTNQEPNVVGMNHIIGVAQISSSNNLHIVCNDASGTATTIDLGANFPANTISADAYELALFNPANSSAITWTVRRLGTAFESSGTLTTDLPAANQLLAPQIWRCNNATALAVGIDLISLYIETDY